ncbi:MAG: hypothetical protein IKZ38_04340 [Clostridia bacterium]|nr:hypothetical protein [Clostridia bacterium]
MDYEKKVVLLKQVIEGYSILNRELCGIARIESENGVCKLYLSFINLKGVERGEYIVFIMDGNKKLYSFNLGARPQTVTKTLLPFPQINGGFCVGLEHLQDCLPRKVAYGVSSDFKFCEHDFNTAVAEKCLSDFKEEKRTAKVINKCEKPEVLSPVKPITDEDEQQPNEDSCELNAQKFSSDFSEFAKEIYDDEAVATENYYDADFELEKKLKAVKEWDFESCDNENELFNMLGKEETEKEQPCARGFEDENRDCQGERFTPNRPYLQSVREQVEKIFSRFPKEDCLRGYFPDSRWVKIPYAKNKYYLVGLIRENYCEKYLCYGVPARYSEKPPEQLDGYCSFIPLSVCDVKGNGFWMIFQDAVTGKCVTPTKL